MSGAVTSAGDVAPPPRAQRSHISWLLATFFGIGFLKPGPGTWASAVTVALWWLAAHRASPANLWVYSTLAAALVTIIGVPVCTTVAVESGVNDPGFAVIDEVAGQLIALIAVPLEWQYILGSFILFRGFDIFKPPPLRQLEKLPGGSGIMLDDVGAGIYVFILMQVLSYFHLLR